MKLYETLQQGTEEWLLVRLGKFTASDAQSIGNNGKGLETLCLEKASEILTKQLPEQYSNEDIARGKELEAEARNAYELATGNLVKEVGFVELSEQEGCSPDGLIGEDGLIEIKCKNDKNHLLMLLGKKIDSKYEWQIQMQLYITGRKWCDFVSYNPNYEHKDLVIIRVHRDEEKQNKLKEGLESGKKQLKQILEKVRG